MLQINLILLKILSEEFESELDNILSFWEQNSVDEINGGFIGQIDENNVRNYEASKGLILNARILWTFSAAYKQTKNQTHFELAQRAYQYLITYFYDKLNKGFYWLLSPDGKVIDGKKHIYSQTFVIYGLSEYYTISHDQNALDLAIEIYHLIVEKSKDLVNGGYTEAFSADWKELSDLRLSDKDVNVQKTMNTHLHIVEAFANLYESWADEELKSEIISILYLINEKFIDHKSGHLKLFFDNKWQDHTDVISYGHDVEASWLLLRCAEIVEDDKLIEVYKEVAIKLMDSSISAIDADGGLWYEKEINSGAFVKEKHWWPQSEFVIGAMNAYQLTSDNKYLNYCKNNWTFIKEKMINPTGEWFWGIGEDYLPMANQDKAGFWKCPYHNARMCLELINRLKSKEITI